MIKQQIKINYTIEFTEQQLKELYTILKYQRLTTDHELLLLYHQLQERFEWKEDFEYASYVEDYK